MLFSFSGLSAVSHAATLVGFAGGTGTYEDPWQIATAAQLDLVRNYLSRYEDGVFIDNSDKHFILMDNIDLGVAPYNEGAGWLPIGDYDDDTYFEGSFNGNGKVINGLTINRPDTTDIGLFGSTSFADIKNVSLNGVSIIGLDYSGSLVGSAYYGSISNSYARGSLVARNFVGGLVGENTSGNLTNNYAVVSVTGTDYTGGLVGYNSKAINPSNYYNSEIAGQTDTSKGEPRSTADMTYPYNAATTYIGWDFVNIWDIQNGVNNGYPFIRQQTEPNAEFAGGDGSEADPYQITTAAHLNNVRNYQGETYTDKHFLLMNDIDLTSYVSSGGAGYNDGQGWQPIGYSTSANLLDYTNCFFGSFDGGEHTISGLIINRQPTNYADFEQCGLFGAVVDADIHNLNLDVQMTGTWFAGGLAGYAIQSTVDNIQVTGLVTGNNMDIGGLIGSADGTVVIDCSMAGTVSGTAGSVYTGGLIGYGNNATMTNCYTDATVSGYYAIGGLAGSIETGSSMTGCYATGSVTAPITNTGIDIYSGGLVGVSSGSIINQCYATGDVSGSESVGGLCGLTTNGKVSDSYAKGSVTGIGSVGGLVGENSYSIITNSYAVGLVNGTGTNVGGLVGGYSPASISKSFYDSDTTGKWSDNLSINELGIPKTTIEMMQQATFTGWDFINTWGIVENGTYPYLLFEPVTPTTYTVIYNGNGNTGGTVPLDSNLYLTSDTITALGNTGSLVKTGYTFGGWNTLADGSGTTYAAGESFDMGSSNVTLYAKWTALPTYTVNYSIVSGSGKLFAIVDDITIISGDKVVEGKDVIFSADPIVGYRVKEWTLNTVKVSDNTTNSFTVEALAADITVTVEFELIPPETHTVNYSIVSGNGKLFATVDDITIISGAEVLEGKDVIFSADPIVGYRVKEWTLDGTAVVGNISNIYTLEALAADVTVTVEFELIPPITYIVTYDVYSGSGSIGATDDGTAFNSGLAVEKESQVVFTAAPDTGWQVADWYIDGTATGLTDLSYTITSLGAIVDVEVEFEPIPPMSGYIVSVYSDPSDGGIVTGGGNYETGDRVKVSATANENFVFIHWTEGSTVVCKGATYNFKIGTENRNLVAHFEATVPTTSWIVTTSAKPSEGGSVIGGGLYEEGDLVEVTATANSGYRFINWTEGLIEVSKDSVYSFTMGTTGRSLTANFIPVGTGWPSIIKLSAIDITNTSVKLQLSQSVPDALNYKVYIGDVLYKSFDAASFADMKIDNLTPSTFYKFTVQALFSDNIETSDGPSIKIKTKK
jgi:uncharacterized repeat protein (TIGR02543 family)